MIWDLDRGLQMKVQTRGLRTAVFHRAGSSDTLDRTVPTLLAVFVGHRGPAHEENQHDQVYRFFPTPRCARVAAAIDLRNG